MKKQDIASVILIAVISMLIAFVCANAVIGDPKDEVVKVPTIEKISGGIAEPNPEIFNARAINPTVPIVIGEGSGQGNSGGTEGNGNQGQEEDENAAGGGTETEP